MSFNKDNQQKTLAGKATNLTLYEVLNEIEEVSKLNVSVKKNYLTGYDRCEKQFKMDYQICFEDHNNEKWLIKSTSSIRSDRIYGNEFFAQNIKIIDKAVTKIFVVIPDSVTDAEMKNKEAYSKKIKSDKYISFIDDILTFSELRDKVLEYASEKIVQGLSANILGDNAEVYISKLLCDDKNWRLWNNFEEESKLIKSSTYRIFSEILKEIDLKMNEHRIIDIQTTRNIPKLKNRGYPKTDVGLDVEYEIIENNEIYKLSETISIKNTSAETVSIHEGDISDVISALEIESNSGLAEALRAFQQYGSEKKLKENDLEAFNILHEELSEYNSKLIKLFIFGENSPLVTEKIQIANLILYTKKFMVRKKEKYTEEYLKKYVEKGQFGTPFKWTYPSKKRSQKIQIKGFTNNKK